MDGTTSGEGGATGRPGLLLLLPLLLAEAKGAGAPKAYLWLGPVGMGASKPVKLARR
jgi:hypothetical protein